MAKPPWLTVLLALMAVASAGQDRDGGSGSLSGIVVDGMTGRPVGGATVSAEGVPIKQTDFPMEQSGSIIITGTEGHFGSIRTAADGRFKFDHLPKGTFQIGAYKNGWSYGLHGQESWNGPIAMIGLADRQQVNGLRVPIWPMASLSGQVVDERGRSMTGITVSALSLTSVAGQVRFSHGPSATSDDRGEFTLTVDAGEYVIAASEGVTISRTGTRRAPAVNGRPSIYVPVFYPSARTFSAAEQITVAPGESREGLTLRLVATPTYSITGTVAGARLNPGPYVELWDDDDESTEPSSIDGAKIDSQSRYRFPGVPAGRYTIRILQLPPMPFAIHAGAPLKALPAEPTLWAERQVVVSDRDVEAPLTLAEGVRINGRVEFNGARERPALRDLNREELQVLRSDGVTVDQLLRNQLRGTFLQDGRFTTIQLPPARYLIRTWTEGWFLRSVMAGARDLIDTPIDLGTTNIDDVVITFSDRAAVVGGRVTRTGTGTSFRSWVVFFPVDRALWTDYGRYSFRIAIIETGSASTYEAWFRPGAYYAIALDRQPVRFSSDVLSSLASMATVVTLTDAVKTSLDLTVRSVPR